MEERELSYGDTRYASRKNNTGERINTCRVCFQSQGRDFIKKTVCGCY